MFILTMIKESPPLFDGQMGGEWCVGLELSMSHSKWGRVKVIQRQFLERVQDQSRSVCIVDGWQIVLERDL